MKTVKVGNIKVGGINPIVLFGGPCVIENEKHLLAVGKQIKKIADKVGIPYVLKTSFDKANRTSIDSYRGPGLKKGLQMIKNVKEELGVPALTDIHEIGQVQAAADVVDIIQIPAFLCRQTDLLCAAAKSGIPVNVKKGQFVAPWDMKEVANKLEACGCKDIILTERGYSFGYNNMVVDMRSLVIMRELGYPVMFDATHSVQLPGGQGNASGGQREHIYPLVRAATATGIDAIFMEIHDEPDKAPCDGPCMLPLAKLEAVLKQVKEIDRLVK